MAEQLIENNSGQGKLNPTPEMLNSSSDWKKVRGASNTGFTYIYQGNDYADLKGKRLFIADANGKIGGSGYDDFFDKKTTTPKTGDEGDVLEAGTVIVDPAPTTTPGTNTTNPGTTTDYYANGKALGQEQYDAQNEKLMEALKVKEKALYDSLKYGEGVLAKNLESAQSQAYLQNQMQQKNLPQQLAALGVTGGGSEQTYSSLLGQYQNMRGAAQSSHDDNLGSLLNTHNTNIAELQEAYLQKDAEAISKIYDVARDEARYWSGFDYTKERDKIADQKDERDYNYKVERDAVADRQWQEEFDREDAWRAEDQAWLQKNFDNTNYWNQLSHNLELDKYYSTEEQNRIKNNLSSAEFYTTMVVSFSVNGNCSYDEAVDRVKQVLDKFGITPPNISRSVIQAAIDKAK